MTKKGCSGVRCFAVLFALATSALATGSVGAQADPLRVVQRSDDGTLYVVQGSYSWTLVPDQISDTDLTALNLSGERDGLIGPVSPPVQVVQASDGSLYMINGQNAWTLLPEQISDSAAAALSPTGEIDGTFPNELFSESPPASPVLSETAPSSGNTTTTIPFQPGWTVYGDGVRVDQTTGMVYAAIVQGMVVIDGNNNSVVTRIRIDGGPTGLAVDPAVQRVYFGTFDAVTTYLSILDTMSNTVTGKAQIGPAQPRELAVDPNTHRVFGANPSPTSGQKDVWVFDEASGVVSAWIGLDPSLTIRKVAVNSQTRRLYIPASSSTGQGSIFVVDESTNTVVARIQVPSAATRDVAVDSTRNLVYALGAGTLTFINGASNAVTGTVDLGLEPGKEVTSGIDVDPQAGKAYVSVLGQGHGELLTIDASTQRVSNTLPLTIQPIAIAVNPTTHRVYLANNGPESLTVIQE